MSAAASSCSRFDRLRADAKVFQIVEGTSEIQRKIVSTYLKNDTGALQGRG
ncbi:MAG: hypothetical protein E6G26_06635 [Actinobacteria bacterium]|nr:MAG: hypothetical protein E6G26_06635 [Actinomycetota bacterium]